MTGKSALAECGCGLYSYKSPTATSRRPERTGVDPLVPNRPEGAVLSVSKGWLMKMFAALDRAFGTFRDVLRYDAPLFTLCCHRILCRETSHPMKSRVPCDFELT